jgi:type VI secretion system protein ImpM
MTLTVGILGKHPAFGDFLRHGVSDEVAGRITGWIDPTLHALRDQQGDRWEAFWDTARGVRFWIGRAVAGRTLAGVLRPSRDRVGRRYPLVLMAEGVDLPAPVEAPDQAFHAALEAHLDAMRPGEGARSLLAGLDPAALPAAAEPPEALALGPILWAHHPGGDLAALLEAAAPVDRARAQTARSYWWAPGDRGRAAVWLGQPGLPAPASLGWLLAGLPAAAPAADPAADTAGGPTAGPPPESAAAADEAAHVP